MSGLVLSAVPGSHWGSRNVSPAGKEGTTIVLYCSIVFRFKHTWKLTVHSLVGEHLSCFQVLTIATKAAANMCVQVFCVNTGFCLSWVDVWEWDCWMVCQCRFHCIRSHHMLFHLTGQRSVNIGGL